MWAFLLEMSKFLRTSADIYSLGQLMYFIITTRRPYAGQQLRQVVHVVHVKYPWVLFRMTGLCKGFSTASIMSSTADDGFDGE